MFDTIEENRWTRTLRLEELRRKNVNALAMDALYLFTVAFFAYLALQSAWAAVIAAIPLASAFLLGYRSSPAFLAVEVLIALVTVLVVTSGLV